jgi:uncharacterized RDD family membrane protein YckC
MAGFWHRAVALAIDVGLIALAVYLVLRVGIGKLDLSALPRSGLQGIDYLVYLLLHHFDQISPILLLILLASAGYFFLFQAIFSTTPGKRALNLRIVDGRGRRIGPLRALWRTVGYGISVSFFMMGFLWAAFDLERRSLHDVLCGTYVIVGRASESEATTPGGARPRRAATT